MTNNISLEFLQYKKAILEKDLTEMNSLVETYKANMDSLNLSKALKIRNNIINDIDIVNKQIESSQVLSEIDERNQKTSEKLSEILKLLESKASNFENNLQIKELGSQALSLVESSQESFEQIKKQSLSKLLLPQMSILRPNVKLIDANLTYKYVDLQSDTNIFVGLTSLFLGTGIATAISLGISRATTAEDSVISIYFVVTIMSLIVAGIFGYLAFRAHKKSMDTRRLIETETSEFEFEGLN